MRKALAAGLAAVTFGGAVAAAAAPAAARPYDHRYYDYRRDRNDDNDAGVAIAAGVIGLALGAALASSSHNDSGWYDNDARGYYGRGYGYSPGYSGYSGYSGYGYAPNSYAYGYRPGYRTCQSTRWTRDPYTGRRVRVTRNYAC